MEINQEKFIKDTYEKLYSNINKFILETNYSNIPSIKLRKDMEEYKSKFKKDKTFNKKPGIDINKLHSIFPSLLNQTKNPYLLFPDSHLFTTKIKEKNIFRGFLDIKNLKQKKIKNKNKNNLKIEINNEINNNKIFNQYNDKYYKYNNDEKNKKFFHNKIYDKYNNTVIQNSDITRGIYDMNIKKLIPRGADVTRTMNLWGNPIKILGNDVKNIYKKSSSKDDIISCEVNKLMPNKYTFHDIYKTQTKSKSYFKSFDNNINNKNKKNEINNNTKFFLTTYDDIFTNFSKYTKTKTFYNKSSLSINDIHTPSKANTFYDVLNQKKITLDKSTINDIDDMKMSKTYNKFSYTKPKNFFEYLKKKETINDDNNIIIKYKYFELIEDSDFIKFKKKNQNIWPKIDNLLSNFKILFEKLSMNTAFIDSNKILKLIEYYKGKINLITNKNLLMCLNNDDLKAKGYDTNNENIIYGKIKLAFIIRIQKNYRKRLAYKKYIKIKNFISYLTIIQKNIKGKFIRKNIHQKINDYRKGIHDKYIEIFNKFKEDYNNKIYDNERIEIHINSLSYKGNYNPCITDKFSMKETLQLSRLIRLKDPKLEIIYIIPYELPKDVINYYFSILEKLGIKDFYNRINFFIPEATSFLPLNYCLTKLLFFSTKTIQKIKNLVKNKNKKCYIVPGIIGSYEEYLSVDLNIPILMSPYSIAETIFNKSDSKNIFEINNIPFPISAWNITNEDEFYSSLVHLITSYPNINIWIFKSNWDYNSTGIAYLNTDEIDAINYYRNFIKKNNSTTDKSIFRKKLFFELKNILKKYASFAYPNLYKNWNQYLSHFLSHNGVIECCPTKGFGGIMGKPCIPIYIEPNGNINLLPSYEKINTNNFKNIINTSPQKSIDEIEMINLGNKLGNILFNKGIIGYISIECIIFHNGETVLYWCVDVKYGYTQTMCDLEFCSFLYNQSFKQELIDYENNNSDNNNKENLTSDNNIFDNNESFNYNLQFKDSEYNDNSNSKEKNIKIEINEEINKKKENKLILKSMFFSIPYITCGFIPAIKLRDLLNKYKISNLIYNMIKKEGIILNLCDSLECGIFGLCGIISFDDYDSIIPELKLWRLIEASVSIVKEIIFSIQKAKVVSIITNFYKNSERSDIIDFQYILNKVKKKIKEKEEQQKIEEEKRKKLAGSLFI